MKYQKIHNKIIQKNENDKEILIYIYIYIYIYISKTYISPKESQKVIDNLRKIITA